MCASYPNGSAEARRISVSETVAGHPENRTEAAGLIESQGIIGSSQESGEWLCTMICPNPYRRSMDTPIPGGHAANGELPLPFIEIVGPKLVIWFLTGGHCQLVDHPMQVLSGVA